MPQAATWTRMSLGPGVGMGRSERVRFLYSARTRAFIGLQTCCKMTDLQGIAFGPELITGEGLRCG